MAGEAGLSHRPLPISDGYSSPSAASSASPESASASDSEDELLYNHLARGRLSRQSGTSSTATAFSQKPGPDGSRVIKKRRSIPKLGLGLNTCCTPPKPQTPRMSDIEPMCTSSTISFQDTILTPHSPPIPERGRRVSSPRVIDSYLGLSRRTSVSTHSHIPGQATPTHRQSSRRVSQTEKTKHPLVYSTHADDGGHHLPELFKGADEGNAGLGPMTSEEPNEVGRPDCYGLSQSETSNSLSGFTSIHSNDEVGYISPSTTVTSPLHATGSPSLSLGGSLSPLAGILRRGDDPYMQAEYKNRSPAHQQSFLRQTGVGMYDNLRNERFRPAEDGYMEDKYAQLLQALHKQLPPTPNNNVDYSTPMGPSVPRQNPHQNPATPPSQCPLEFPEPGNYNTSGIEFFLPNRVVFVPFGPNGRLETPPGAKELKYDPYRFPHRTIQVEPPPHRPDPKVQAWEEKCRSLEAKLAQYPVSRHGNSHVFVDMSNIFVGFVNCFKNARGISKHQRIKAPKFAFDLFARVLERNHSIEKRVVAGSSNKSAAQRHMWPHYLQDAEKCGYTMNIFDRVLKEKTPKSPRQWRHAPAPTGYASGQADLNFTSDSNDDYVPKTVTRNSEQGVDENLHLNMMHSILDNINSPGTMVLATGDAAAAEFSAGFKQYAIRALEKGWHFELVSWNRPISSAWYDAEFQQKWGDKFRIVELDPYLYDLVGDI